MAPSRWRTSYS
jgi:hypothetical protein